MIYREIQVSDDRDIAAIIRGNLKDCGLDIPGTAYFDENLDRLGEYYLSGGGKRFYLVAEEEGRVLGGAGFSQIDFFEDCAELQKLYLCDRAKGRGAGYVLLEKTEEKARSMGFKRMYLETHSVLSAAIHIYEKTGYREIPKPPGAVHSAMDRFFLKEL